MGCQAHTDEFRRGEEVERKESRTGKMRNVLIREENRELSRE